MNQRTIEVKKCYLSHFNAALYNPDQTSIYHYSVELSRLATKFYRKAANLCKLKSWKSFATVGCGGKIHFVCFYRLHDKLRTDFFILALLSGFYLVKRAVRKTRQESPNRQRCIKLKERTKLPIILSIDYSMNFAKSIAILCFYD